MCTACKELDALHRDLFRGNIIEFAIGERERERERETERERDRRAPRKRFRHIDSGLVEIRLID